MSVKRQATTDLNHDNWDQEDTSEQKEMGQFKPADKDVLEKRVIRTAKRRTQVSNEPTKGVFSGFGGFNKTQPSSFDFLANLTNGTKNNNGSTSSSNTDTSVTSTLFSNKAASPISGGLFGTSTPITQAKSPLSTPLAKTTMTSPFGAAAKTSPSAQLFTATKADSTVTEFPFKIQSVSSTADSNTVKLTSSAISPMASNMFGVSSTSPNDSKSLFSSTNSTSFKIQPVSSTTTAMVQTSFGISPKPAVTPKTPEKKAEEKTDDKKMKYYSKLKGLNESVSDWISKHVAQTPLCILSPIFKDYEKYLKEITEEYQSDDKEQPEKTIYDSASEAKSADVTIKSDNISDTKVAKIPVSTVFGSGSSNATSKPATFGAQNNFGTAADNKPASFSFGIKTSTNNASSTTTTNTGFSFGVTTSTLSSGTSSPFALTTNTTSNQSTTAPFSFGIGKPFSFSSNNVQQPSTEPAAAENEDEPPKVDYTPVKEDNSVYEKKCKIFVKKDGNFADKGVGTLYVKKIEESGKHQLLVRANTNLGTVLLNLVLASAIPTQRMGKNNVMLVCIPTPDAKPPPTPVLIRVKTGEEADELLEALNKYKG